ncbi:hypothetical protein BGX29_001918, partial [Mortierella sp. GBA35]
MYPNYNYNCAWNSGTAVLAILGQISDGSSLGHKRIGIEIPAVYSSFIGKGKQFQPSPISNSSSSDTVVNFKKGRSVLMPVDPKVQKEGGVPSLSWLYAQIDGPVLTINRFAYGYPFPPLNYTIWHMDNYGPGLRKYSHLAHSNDKLYVIGSTVSTGGLAVTTLQGEIDDKAEAFQLYSFNGTVFRHVSPIPAGPIASVTTLYSSPCLAIVPPWDKSMSTTPRAESVPWAYLSPGFGFTGYSLDFASNITAQGNNTSGNGNTTSTTLNANYQNNKKLFQLNYNWNSNTNDERSYGREERYSTIGWVGGAFGLLIVVTAVAKLVQDLIAARRKITPRVDTSDAATSTAGPTGVTRTLYGEDASDALP